MTETNENAVREGRIIRGVGGIYSVDLDGGATVSCRVRGALRATFSSAARTAGAYHTGSRLDRPLTGDRVRVELAANAAGGAGDGSEAVICAILPRKNALIRPPLANIDYIFIAAAAAKPAPVLPTLDKLVSIAEYNGIEPVIVIGKRELDEAGSERIADIYRRAGYAVFPLSCATGEGVESLSAFVAEKLSGRVAAFAGASGVGKSTLLNALFPGLGLRTGGVSEKIGRGRHTTREASLFPLPGGGYIADTPGFSLLDFENFDFFGLDDLPGTMREFAPYYGHCRYADCTHTKEEGCAVLEAVREGVIAPERHKSYLEMYTALKAKPFWGNFDSMPEGTLPEGVEKIKVPAEKDDTDTQLAVEAAVSRGADDIVIIGGLGGRLDHTLSNLHILEDLAMRGVYAVMTDGQNRARFIRSGSALIGRSGYRYLSLIAADDKVKGVTAEGCKYPLSNATLTRRFQYAVSNEIDGNCALISVKKGGLFIIESTD